MKKRYVMIGAAFLAASLWLSAAKAADEKPEDPAQLLYKANAAYEKGEYNAAVTTYLAILDRGIESGALYYNIGNGFFKLGKIGYAILCYEKARRYIPGDSDLKANLTYARTFVDDAALQEHAASAFMRTIVKPFRLLNLNGIAVIALLLYILVIIWTAANIANGLFAKRAIFGYAALIAVFAFTLTAFAIRYYHEEMVKLGVVVQKSAECKYEPIEKSTTYYAIREGQKVRILKTRNGWRQIRRFDGKTAWVPKEAVEEI